MYKSVSEQGTPASHSITAGEAGLSERGREKISQEILVHSPPQNLALLRKLRQQSKSSATLRFSPGFSDCFLVVFTAACLLMSSALPCLFATTQRGVQTVSWLCLFIGSASLPSC